ncbi:MAG TPA: HdeD family acid-resistance protein [Anaerolineaceae bacterium]|nr:HdeD family acid-resistance protein [Anaerolineaceae bacterium]
MLQSIARNWWLIALRGVAAIILGVLCFVYPADTIYALVIVFGIYALVDGVLAVIDSFQIREAFDQWWVVLLEGLAGILVGILAFTKTVVTAEALLFVIAFWAIFTGIMEIIAAIYFRREIDNEWLLILSGILSVILGVLLVVYPMAGSLAVIWVVGFYAIFFGVLMLFLAFEVRSLAQRSKA